MASTAVVVEDVRLKKVSKKVYDSPEELTLVHRARNGDKIAFDALHNAYHSRVFVTIKRMLSDEDVALWIVNQTFYQIWKHLSGFKEQSKFSTWITRIATNEALMYLRSEKKRQNEVSLDLLFGSDGLQGNKKGSGSNSAQRDNASQRWLATRDLDLEGIPDRQLLERAISQVPQQFREILRLRFWEGMSMDEISVKVSADELEPVSVSAVKSRLLRAKRFLTDEVEELS